MSLLNNYIKTTQIIGGVSGAAITFGAYLDKDCKEIRNGISLTFGVIMLGLTGIVTGPVSVPCMTFATIHNKFFNKNEPPRRNH